MSDVRGGGRRGERSVDRYRVRILGGSLELDFPGRTIDTPRAPALLGPLILLVLNPGRELTLNTFKVHLHGDDAAFVSTAQIQTPISRLRVAGLPIPPRVYRLDVAPSDVDVVDFDTRAKTFIEEVINPDRLNDEDVAALKDLGFELHRLWEHDPGIAVGNQPRLSALFESQRRRNRRFGAAFVRLLLRAGEFDRAEDVLEQYVERYGLDEIFRDLEVQVHRSRRQATTMENSDGAVAFPGPIATHTALTQLRDQLATSAKSTIAQLGVGAHNLDRHYIADRILADNSSGGWIVPDNQALIGDPVESPGGAAPNTTFALARLGQRVSVAGIVADDHDGRLIRKSLEDEGVDLSLLITAPPASGATGHSLTFSDHAGGRLTFIRPGVNELLARTLWNDKSARRQLVVAACNARTVNLSSFSGDAERRMQEELLAVIPEHVIVGFDPGALYAPHGLDRLAAFVLRCDVLVVVEHHLRQMIGNSSANVSLEDEPRFRAALDALFRWRAARVDRPWVVVVRRHRVARARIETAAHSSEMIMVAAGRRTVEELVSAGAPASADVPVVDAVGQGDAIAAAVHLGLLTGAPLDECADLALVLANEVGSKIGSRAGLPHRSTVTAAWARYFPRAELPSWIPRD